MENYRGKTELVDPAHVLKLTLTVEGVKGQEETMQLWRFRSE